MKPTIKDVASLAQVSVGTVSAVLNNKAHVTTKNREKVLGAVSKLGYKVNPTARRLVLNRSDTLGIVMNANTMSSSSFLFYSRVTKGVMTYLAGTAYHASLAPFWDGDGRSIRLSPVVQNGEVDGLLIFDVVQQAILNKLKEIDVPLVLVDNHLAHPEECGVDNDDRAGIYKATSHLIGLGHKRIGFINAPIDHPLGRRAWEGFTEAHEEADIPLESKLTAHGDLEIDSGYRAMGQILKKGSHPTAVVSVNDSMAIGAIKALREHGLGVPGDVAIVGMDDLEISDQITPALTTVRIHRERIGLEAARMLLQRIASPGEKPARLIVDNELVVRESCGAGLRAPALAHNARAMK